MPSLYISATVGSLAPFEYLKTAESLQIRLSLSNHLAGFWGFCSCAGLERNERETEKSAQSTKFLILNRNLRPAMKAPFEIVLSTSKLDSYPSYSSNLDVG